MSMNKGGASMHLCLIPALLLAGAESALLQIIAERRCVEIPDESKKLWGCTFAEQDLAGHLPVH